MIQAARRDVRATLRARQLPTPGGDVAAAALTAAVIAAVLTLWAASLPLVHTEDMGATGLVSVLPVPMFVALGLLTVSMSVCLGRRGFDTRLFAIHVAVLIFILYATPAVVEPEPSFEAAYRHVGIADLIGRTGGVDTAIDGYFSWPGFFIVLTFVTHAAGLGSALSLVPWAPLFYNVLYLGPLLLIFGSLTANRRLVWLAVWLFYVANWCAQDYLSPQATSYFLYLVVIAVLLRWFTPPVQPASPTQRVGLLAIVIAACLAVVSMHQLTPFALLTSVTALVLVGRCEVRLLPVLLGVMIAGWEAFMTVGFLSGNLSSLLGSVGNIGGTVETNVGERIGGDAGHRLVVDTRLFVTASLWVVAISGWWFLRDRWRPVSIAAALALATIPLLVLQPYGGEILIRVFLFSLPFTAFLAAAMLVTVLAAPSLPAILGTAEFTLALLAAFLFARYGNERMDSFSSGDVAGARALYRMAPPGSQLLAVSQPLPWQSQDYNSYEYERLANVLPSDARRRAGGQVPFSGQVRDVMRGAAPRKSFLIVTRSQVAGDELLGSRVASAATVEARLRASRLFRVAYANPDATIFVLTRRGASGAW
jgi:hypothetical protein